MERAASLVRPAMKQESVGSEQELNLDRLLVDRCWLETSKGFEGAEPVRCAITKEKT